MVIWPTLLAPAHSRSAFGLRSSPATSSIRDFTFLLILSNSTNASPRAPRRPYSRRRHARIPPPRLSALHDRTGCRGGRPDPPGALSPLLVQGGPVPRRHCAVL